MEFYQKFMELALQTWSGICKSSFFLISVTNMNVLLIDKSGVSNIFVTEVWDQLSLQSLKLAQMTSHTTIYKLTHSSIINKYNANKQSSQ